MTRSYGWLDDAFDGYFWRFIGSAGIGLGAVAIALTFRPPRPRGAALSTPGRGPLMTGSCRLCGR